MQSEEIDSIFRSEIIILNRILKDFQDIIQSSNRKAKILKSLNIFLNVIIIATGAVIAVLANNCEMIILVQILGAVIATSKTWMSVFNPERKSVLYMQISVKASNLEFELIKMKRELERGFSTTNMNSFEIMNQITNKLTEFQKELTVLKFRSFLFSMINERVDEMQRQQRTMSNLYRKHSSERREVEVEIVPIPLEAQV